MSESPARFLARGCGCLRDTQPIPNQLHPRNYTNVTAVEQLTNQNFLIIRAGNDNDPYACPNDGPSDALNTNTWDHQPPRP